MMVKDFPESERPVNRLREKGPSALSGIEVLASILQTGDAIRHANELFVKFGGLAGLDRADIVEIESAVPGVGRAQAARIKAALELGKRALSEQSELYQVRCPADVYKTLCWMENKEAEHFVVIYLDTRNRIIEQETLYVGTLNTSVVRVSEVFKGAVRRNCAAIAVAHNHPSGDPTPSAEDIALTRRLVDAGKLMEIEFMDHLIIGNGGRYVGLRERGLGFETA